MPQSSGFFRDNGPGLLCRAHRLCHLPDVPPALPIGVTMTQATAFERFMLDLINEERTSRGLDPLQLEQNLNQSADAHSLWMLREDVFSHTGRERHQRP